MTLLTYVAQLCASPAAGMGAALAVLVATPAHSHAMDLAPVAETSSTAYTRDHERVAVAFGRQIIIKDAASAAAVRRLRMDRDVCSLWSTPDGANIFVKACDGTVGFWNLETMQLDYLDRR